MEEQKTNRSSTMGQKERHDLESSPEGASVGEVVVEPIRDAVFGTITEEGPNYRSVGWIASAVLMMKTQFGLGVLSIPSVFDTLGMIPGVICLVVMGIVTTWSGYAMGVFKLNHREVYGLDDAAGLMLGNIGRNFYGIGFYLYWLSAAGSGLLSISIGLNAVSEHGACTAVFMAVAGIMAFLLSSIQTLSKISWLAWTGLICIFTSILILTIAVGVQDRPATAPTVGPWQSDYKIIGSPSFTDGISAVCSLIFAYGAIPAFLPIAAEMRDPHLYSRSLLIAQGIVSAFYIVVGCVVYYYCGSYVSSPALGSAGVLLKKICYGIALPGLIVSTVLTTHMASKYVFIRLLRGSKHLVDRSPIHWGVWLACTFGSTIIAYVIASGVPIFSGLVSLIGALLGSLMMFQPAGAIWLYDNWAKGKVDRKPKWVAMAAFSIAVIVLGCFLTVAGTYGSVVSIIDSYKEAGGTLPWTCDDNSGSVSS